MDAAAARDRFAAARVARLATTGASGVPHVVPITFAVSGNTVYFAVDHKPKRSARLKRLANIAENPRVAVLADHYADDWDELWWVRGDGTASVVSDASERELAVDLLAERYPQYLAVRPLGDVVAIGVESWNGWSATP